MQRGQGYSNLAGQAMTESTGVTIFFDNLYRRSVTPIYMANQRNLAFRDRGCVSSH